MNPRVTVPLALALISFPAHSHPEQVPSFPAQAEIVVVDAVVFDKSGNAVAGLTKDDFLVKEDGQAQAIASFEAVGLPESPPAIQGVDRFLATNSPPPPGSQPPRSFVILFDDAQLTRPSGDRARAALKHFLETGLHDADEVTLVSSATRLWWSTRLAEGREDLMALLDRLQGRRVVHLSSDRISDYEATRIVARDVQVTQLVQRRYLDAGVTQDPPKASQLDLSPGQILVQANAASVYADVRARNQATLHALERVANALNGARGRKTVILVSDGFVYDPTLDFREVTRAARRSNSTVYFLDARGLQGSADLETAEVASSLQERDVLATIGQAALETQGSESVALETGGFTVHGANDLGRGLLTIARESRSYYLIGYTSSNTKRDGKYRKIQVEVRRPGLDIRARKGYFAPGDEKAPTTPPGTLDPRVRQSLDSPFLASGIPLRMAVYLMGANGAGKLNVLLVGEADPRAFAFREAGDRFETTLDSYILVTARDKDENEPQEKEITLSLPAPVRAQLEATWLPIQQSFELPPGRHQMRLLLRDRTSGYLGSVRAEFDVPTPKEFRVSTPILTDSLQPGPAGAPPRPIPLARRTFASGENLLYLFEVHGALKEPTSGLPRVTCQYDVRRGDGTSLLRTEPTLIPTGPQGQIGRQITLSLKGVPDGNYVVALTLRDQVVGETLKHEDAFVVRAR